MRHHSLPRTTGSDDEKLMGELMRPNPLDTVIEFVVSHYTPDDLFDMPSWIVDNYPDPEEVYGRDKMDRWASDNGYEYRD